MKKYIPVIIALVTLSVILVACGGNNNTVQNCNISNISVTSISELEEMEQPTTLTAGKQIYANIHFVESPKETAYTAIWYLDDREIKREIKETENDMQDVIVYELEAEQALNGVLKLEIAYDNTILLTKELEIQ